MSQEYVLFGLGNPLLDIQAVTYIVFTSCLTYTVAQTSSKSIIHSNGVLNSRYNINANDAILAEEKHLPLYEELVQKYQVHYIAGGAAQNAIRGAQVTLILRPRKLTNSIYYLPIQQST